MSVTFVGHLSRDIDIVRGVEKRALGGGVVHNGITAARLGVPTRVLTRVTQEDAPQVAALFASAGVALTVDPSETPTSIENSYENGCPDSRVSRLLSRAAPFCPADIENLNGDAVHVNPLWFPEFPPDLLPLLRARTRFLSIDAQGFLRRAADDGRMRLVDWEEKARYLPLLDLLKVDGGEALVLTGEKEPRRAAEALAAYGVKTIILTRADSASVWHDGGFWTFEFSPYDLAHRTGRGDTFTAAYLAACADATPEEAARFATAVTEKKLRYAGPYRG